MALGAGSVTPLQMASAYSVFANGGYRVNPLLISRITDSQGPRASTRRASPALDESMRTIDARNAFVMTSLLQEVTRSGTAAKAQAHAEAPRHLRQDRHHQRFASTPGSPAGRRTSSRVVWMGYDKPRKLGDRETGGGLSLPIWIDYMTTMLKGVPVQEPTRARGRGQPRRRVVLRGVRARRRRQQRRPRGQVGADAAERRRAQRHPRPVPALTLRRRASRSGLEAQRPAGLRAGAGRQHVEELAAVARVDPASADARK